VKHLTISDALTAASRRLRAAGCDTPGLDAELLLAHALQKGRTWLFMYPQTLLTDEQQVKFEAWLDRRAGREPVAYLLGCKEFFGLEFEVSRHVLIPRPETELLIETALEIVDQRPDRSSSGSDQPGSTLHTRRFPFSIADAGTGSGCISVVLAKTLAQASLFAIDSSSDALRLARQNAFHHGVGDAITFLAGNLLEPLPHPVDLVVSNPPYVSHAELNTVSPEVSQYEPRLALDGGADGLKIIRQLLPQAKDKLKAGGSLLVEIGATQGQPVAQLARQYFPSANIQIKQDLAGRDRLLVVSEL